LEGTSTRLYEPEVDKYDLAASVHDGKTGVEKQVRGTYPKGSCNATLGNRTADCGI